MSGYVHPKAAPDPSAGNHASGLPVASTAAPRYYRWIAELLAPYLGESVLEIGSGHGSVTELVASGRRVVATDLAEPCVDILRSRFASWPNVEVRRMDVRDVDLSETFDSTIIVNVLEHIHDDAAVLSALRARLRHNGTCLIYVPAHNWLYGRFDRDSGHYRRYSKRQLTAVVRDAGLRPVKLTYVNILAIPAWVLFSSNWTDRDDAQHVARSLGLWDRLGIPATRALERKIPPPVGLNLFCVARKE